MNLVQLQINDKKVVTEPGRTILEVARANGIADIPTLCHDEQLEPFASCFVCVVEVEGARNLLPACSTRVVDGMRIRTQTEQVKKARKTALELLLSDHYADCVGPCQKACPAGVDIQGYLGLASLGRFEEAIRLIKEKNPLPAVCGRVCTRPCEVSGCRRTLLDEPVGIDYIKRYLADIDLDRTEPFRPEVAASSGKRVAIVGAGPAGLSCAYYLAQRGHQVEILEAQPEAGGMLRYGIPEYRLPKNVLDQEISQIQALGVKLRCKTRLGPDVSLRNLREQNDAVFVALGAWESTKMQIANEGMDRVLTGIDVLAEVGAGCRPRLKGRILVVGGGNTAIDCARVALRLGASSVTVLYRRTREEMPAHPMEVEEAEHEGVKFEFLVAPLRVESKAEGGIELVCQRMQLGDLDASGRRRPVPVEGSEQAWPAEYVLSAVGQKADLKGLRLESAADFLPEGQVLERTRWGTVKVDPDTYLTSVDGVFSGGDLVTGPSTVVAAIGAGRRAAYAIDRYMTTGQAVPEPRSFISQKGDFGKVRLEDLRGSTLVPRHRMPVLPANTRIDGFAEVECGFSSGDVREETARCLVCGCTAYFDCDLRRLATEYGVDPEKFRGATGRHSLERRHPWIELDPNRCILCGRCVRMCSEQVGVGALGFVGRGFATKVLPPMGGGLLDAGCISCGLCLGTCPTGALTPVLSLKHPGPYQTIRQRSICTYCGTGCELDLHATTSLFVRPSRVEAGQTTLGNHCAKGLFGLEYVNGDDRIREASMRDSSGMRGVSLTKAFTEIGRRLAELSPPLDPREIAVFISPRATNEEVYLAQKLAREVLRTPHIDSFSRLTQPSGGFPEIVSSASHRDLLDADTIVTVDADCRGDSLVVDLLRRRAQCQGACSIAIGAEPNLATAVADRFLQCKPGSQPMVLLGLLRTLDKLQPGRLESGHRLARAVRLLMKGGFEAETGLPISDLLESARQLLRGSRGVLVTRRNPRSPQSPSALGFYAAVAEVLGYRHLVLEDHANSQGLRDLGAQCGLLPGYRLGTLPELAPEPSASSDTESRGSNDDLQAMLREKRLRVALVLGEDPLGCLELPIFARQAIEQLELLEHRSG